MARKLKKPVIESQSAHIDISHSRGFFRVDPNIQKMWDSEAEDRKQTTEGLLVNKLRAGDLREPTAAEVVSVVHAMYSNSRFELSRQLGAVLECDRLTTFTLIHYAEPEDVIYFEDRPVITLEENWLGPFAESHRSDFANRIKQGDPRVRSLPFHTTISKMHHKGFYTPSEVVKNNFVIALAGEEGAEKLAALTERVSEKKAIISIPYMETAYFPPESGRSKEFKCGYRCLLAGFSIPHNRIPYNDYITRITSPEVLVITAGSPRFPRSQTIYTLGILVE